VNVVFENFEVNTETRQLQRDGTHVHLAPKAFDLLVALIQERPRVLSKEDLHARIWPGVFVSDASLAMVVAEIRAALGETSQESRFIRTVHRRGYAFQGNVTPRIVATPFEQGHTVATTDYWIVVAGKDIPLRPGPNLVGRDPRASVWLDLPSVSRRHARIRVDDEGVAVEDLGSKNGTRIGDVLVTGEMPVRDGDVVRFGAVTTTFRAWVAEPTRTEAG
jgi:DNA-binding winged helix-turn-helix (wHTH) protein